MVKDFSYRSHALRGNAASGVPASRSASLERCRMHSYAERGNDKTRIYLSFSFITCVLLLFFGSSAFAATIGVNVDRNPVNLNDSFQLVFSSDAEPDGEPDFSPLEKDFSILNQGKSESYSLVNGSASRSVQWTLTVMAKQPGTLTVPPIAFGKDSSAALSVSVTQDSSNAPQTPGSGDEDLFLQVEATPQKPYVQAQIIYTLRLYRKVDIAQAGLTEPEAKDAVVEKLGDDSNYRTEVNGENYVVTERKYAIFPQHSGPLTIQPVVLTAQVVVGGGSRFNGFFGMQSTRAKRITSQSVSVDVQPAPTEFKGAEWLPAEDVQLQEQWSGPIDSAKTGEPLTRTLTLTVKGSTAGQLPDLSVSMQDVKTASGGELKSYPDQPAIKEQKNPDGIVAVRQQKIALMPSQGGEYRLPAIEIPWWNTQTRKLEVARLPAQTLRALGTAAQPAPATQPVEPAQAPQAAAVPVAPAPVAAPDNPLWMGAAIFSTLGWLLTVLYFWRKGCAPAPQQPEPIPERRNDNAAKALQKACQNNDAAGAKDALLAWAKERFNAVGLNVIAMHGDTALQVEIQALQRSLYAKETRPWQGAGLWQAVQRLEKQKTARNVAGNVLEPLYKI